MKIYNFAVLDADVFAVLSANLKYGIDFRHPMSSSLSLRSDLIPDGICSDAFADALSSRTGHTNCGEPDITKPLTDAGKAFADSSFRVTCGAQILKAYQFAVSTNQNEIGTGRTDVDAQCAAAFWNDLGGVWLPKARARAEFQPGQCSNDMVCCQHTIQKIIQLTYRKRTGGLVGSTEGRFITGKLRNDELFFGQAEHFPNSPDDAGVAGHAATEHYWLADGKPTHDGSFVVADHRIAQTQKNIRRNSSFLLTVDDVGLSKDGTPTGKAGDTLCLLDQ